MALPTNTPLSALLGKAADSVSTKRLMDAALLTRPDWAFIDRDSVRYDPTLRGFRQQYMTHYHEKGSAKLNFVEAFEEAMSAWDNRVDMSLVISDPTASYYSPDELSMWLWGPNGEFTGYAKIRAFNDIERRLGRLLPNGHVSEEDIYLERTTMRFKFTVLLGDYTRHTSHYMPTDPTGRSMGYVFTQFLSYADYAVWEHFAAGDPLRIQKVERPAYD